MSEWWKIHIPVNDRERMGPELTAWVAGHFTRLEQDLARARDEVVFFAERLETQDRQYSSAHPQAAMYRAKREALEQERDRYKAALERIAIECQALHDMGAAGFDVVAKQATEALTPATDEGER